MGADEENITMAMVKYGVGSVWERKYSSFSRAEQLGE